MSGPTDDEIRAKAYEIWIAEGQPHGRDYDHWLEAQKQLTPVPTKAAATVDITEPVAAEPKTPSKEKTAKPVKTSAPAPEAAAKTGSGKGPKPENASASVSEPKAAAKDLTSTVASDTVAAKSGEKPVEGSKAAPDVKAKPKLASV